MSIFGSIMDRIFHHGSGAAQAGGTPQAGGSGTQQATSAGPASGGANPGGAAAQGAQRLQNVDVDAMLSQLASKKGGGGNWRTSIVDLLKLLDLDSSLQARKTLAGELNVHAGADGTAEQNIALQKAVMAKLAENGGKVPDSLRH